MPNYDTKTGIHYGVIHQGKVLQAWADSSDAFYPKDSDGYADEPSEFYYGKEGYKATQDSDGPNIMVIQSPYFTYARPCSPCYPNAGDLDNESFGGIKTYCFGSEWFEDSKATYPIYDVKTGKKICNKGK